MKIAAAAAGENRRDRLAFLPMMAGFFRLFGILAVGVAVAAGPVPAAGAGMPPPEGGRPDERPDPTHDALVLASVAPLPRAPARKAPDRRCTGDGAQCIALASYVPDVCRTIEAVAQANGVDVNFFARLIWKESLFDASAVSPAGAQGIAQFMPGTAKLRGLRDAFNPAAALAASAEYLAELSRNYGNLGLAAAAYNGGEARIERYIAAGGGLPAETRAYVHAITGHSVEVWRDAPPVALDLALDKGAPFQTACVTLAANRGLREFRSAPPVLPWGVILASNRDRAGAERQVSRLKNRHAGVLGGESVNYTRGRRAGMPRALHFAQIGRSSRADAEALCGRLRSDGADCMVLRN
jgi:hypothetical protein